MRILVMGGTRFIGVYLTQQLVSQGHDVVLFNRGNRPSPVAGVTQIHGDRTDAAQLKANLSDQSFDVIFDNNGRELADTQPLVEIFKGKLRQFIYISSAGVYQKSAQMPHIEGDAVDPNSRHKGKFATEDYLAAQGIPFTAVRPVYIYGPQNYNPLEEWFFDRIVHDRPIPIPGHGQHLTQLGHCQDLASALVAMVDNPQAMGQIYNISGERFVTFDGLAQACAAAAGKDPSSLQLVHYDPKAFDFGKRKAFPLRPQHFFTSIEKAKQHLSWTPQFDLVAGLRDSFDRDYQPQNKGAAAIDFSTDDEILQAVTA
ncbi:NAD-dependent epimerase/dehydratase family protein [Prochlorothrix hollandica]|uniref:UDP-glucose 4-epimerase n=1 Tax=Prochlorothrix hollandica PCC 9006 = CALU 1027 TaxID=317619 RepID=A0A0M2PZ05_PROHO|nr:NAD-dependent epimerase/dehydratase family protein [Prochlorothrix hollandica]KKI99621.1 3-beta hydroxysteroid dehydrogenase [Prochlorothrix hollandica PCC 9006 = CALU 1027]